MKSLITALSAAAAVTFLVVSVSSGAIPPLPAQSAKPFLGDPQTTAATTPSSLPAGFSDSVVFSGLTNPTNVRFSTDGRVFVVEKSGLLKVFDNLSDATPTQVVDLRQEVDDYWDRGMLGLALDPNFPTTPYVYLMYTYDGGPGQTAPVWSDGCPTPPGPTTDGCVVTGKLVRLQLSGNSVVGSTTLISGEWCQQFPSHSIGDLNFGPDGKLYVSGGDGASFDFTDYGQAGGRAGSPTPKNPCGDPPAGVGGTEAPPTAEGGALRSQSVRRPTGEPVLLNGALLRVDPATGAGAAGNPLASSTSANARRIVAYGMRNPFRFVFRPGTNEVWIGDVGWSEWEEIDRLLDPTTGPTNFGWPCYEGNGRQAGYQSANLNLCNSLYSAGTAVAPYYTYSHAGSVVSGDGCSTANGSVISALSFYAGSSVSLGVQRRALLRRPFAELHLGDDAGDKRASRPVEHPTDRNCCGEPGGHRAGARRRPLLRRLRRRHDPPHLLRQHRHVLRGHVGRAVLQQHNALGHAGARAVRVVDQPRLGQRQPGGRDLRGRLLRPLVGPVLLPRRQHHLQRHGRRRDPPLPRRHPADRRVAGPVRDVQRDDDRRLRHAHGDDRVLRRHRPGRRAGDLAGGSARTRRRYP